MDRFGPLPAPVEELLTAIRCRRKAKALGFEKLILKNEQMRLYFISDPESAYFESEAFNRIMDFIQKGTNKARLKNVGKNFMLIVDQMRSMSAIEEFLTCML
ncbi:MAG: hypothetical protein QM743_03785 [Chitinophagaceae bacterium]